MTPVVVTNGDGSVTSSSATLDVLPVGAAARVYRRHPEGPTLWENDLASASGPGYSLSADLAAGTFAARSGDGEGQYAYAGRHPILHQPPRHGGADQLPGSHPDRGVAGQLAHRLEVGAAPRQRREELVAQGVKWMPRFAKLATNPRLLMRDSAQHSATPADGMRAHHVSAPGSEGASLCPI